METWYLNIIFQTWVHRFQVVWHIISDSPVVKLLNTRLGQILGKETILECTVTSYPRAKITWFKNGIAIEHSYKYRLELFPGHHSLQNTFTLTLAIMTVNVHDYGDYTCEAENRMGKQRASMTLYGNKLRNVQACHSIRINIGF